MDYTEFLKFFIGLFAIINPCGILPVFIDFTTDMDNHEQLKLNLVTNITVVVILFGALFFGTSVLSWFGISLSSFRIAGGILIAMMAYSMLKGNLKGDIGAILAFFVVSFFTFLSANFIYKILHNVGISVITRIMGLILMSLAVEIFVGGLKEEFPLIGG